MIMKREELESERDRIKAWPILHEPVICHSDIVASYLEAIDKIEELEAYLSGIKKGMEMRRIAEGK